MARQFYQEWSEPLTQREAVVLAIGLLISDNLSLPWQDGVSFLKDATHNANSGLTSQAQFSEDLLMASQKDFIALSVNLIIKDSILLIDTVFYVHAQRTAGGNTGSRASLGDNENATPSMLVESMVPVFGLNLLITDNLNQWIDPAFGSVDSSLLDNQIAVTIAEPRGNWFDDIQFVNGSKNILVSDQGEWVDPDPGNQIPYETLDFVLTPSLVSVTDRTIWDLLTTSGNYGPFETFDFILASSLISISDQVRMADGLLGIGFGFAETLTMSDAISSVMELQLQITEQLSMADGFGYYSYTPFLSFADQMFLNDVSGYGYEPYGSAPFGGFVQNGEFLGFGNLVTDVLTLTDALVELPQGGTFSYELLGPLGIEILAGTVSLDSLSFVDIDVIGYGNSIVDQLVLSDTLLLGYGEQITDSMTLSDGLSTAIVLLEVLSDQNQLESQLVNDSFSRANENPLNPANWTQPTGAGALRIVNNECVSNGGASDLEKYTGISWPANQYSEVKIDVLPSGGDAAGPLARVGSDLTYYHARASGPFGSSVELAISKWVSGSSTIIASGNAPLSSGDVLRLDVSENFLSLKVNGVQILSGVDSSIASGSPGLWVLSTSAQVSQWAGGAVFSMMDQSGLGYGLLPSETLSLLDKISVGFGYSETLTLVDAMLLSYGDQIADTMTLTDAFNSFLNQPNLQLTFADSLSMSDALLLSYGEQITDSLTLSDALVLGYRDLLSDSLTLTDSFLSINSIAVIASETLSMLDFYSVGYGYAEQLVLSDFLVLRIGEQISESLTLSDVLLVGYGNLITDALSLTDAFSSLLSAGGLTEVLVDSLSLSDSIVTLKSVPLIKIIADKMFLNDVSGYGFEPYGQAPFGGFVQNGEFLGYGNLVSDLLSLTDAAVAVLSLFNQQLFDSLSLTDQISIGYGLQVFEQFVYGIQLAQDTFNRPDENPIDPTNWTQVTGLNPLQVLNGRCLPTSIGSSPQSGENYTGIAWPDDQFVELTLERSFAFSGFSIILRSDALQRHCYIFEFLDNEDGTCNLSIISANLPLPLHLLWNNPSVPFYFVAPPGPPGSTFRAVAIGSRLLFYLNGVLVGWVDDSDHASGTAGVNLFANVAVTNLQLASFVGGQAVQMLDQFVTGYNLPLSDLMSLSDSISIFSGFINSLSLSDALSLTDQITLGYGLGLSEALSLSDQFLIYINALNLSDVMILSDQVSLATDSLALSDSLSLFDQPFGFSLGGATLSQFLADLMTLSDAVSIIVYITQMGDTLVMSDQMAVGYGDVIAEQLTLVDVYVQNLLGSGIFSEQLADTLSILDQSAIGIGLATSDSLNNWQDLEILEYDLLLIDSSFGATWLDAVLFGHGFGIAVTDSLVLVDALATLLPVVSESLTDLLVLTDSSVLGYGNQITDQLSLSDKMDALFPLAQILADQQAILDQVVVGYGLSATEQLTQSDVVARIGYGDLIAEQLFLSDGISIQELGALISIFPSDQLVISDILSGMGFGLLPADQLLLSEQIIVGYGSKLSDQLTLSDQLSFSYVLFQSPSDTLSMSDSLSQLQVGLFVIEQLLQTDALLLGSGYLITEQLAIVESSVLGFGIILNDQMATQTDQIGAGYGTTVNDQMATQADQTAFVEALLEQLTDANILQLDAISQLFAAAISIGDALVFQEQLTTMYGIITGDLSIAMVDQLNQLLLVPLVLALSDDESAAWLESILFNLIFSPSAIVAHSITVLPRLVAGLQVQAEIQASNLTVTKAEV